MASSRSGCMAPGWASDPSESEMKRCWWILLAPLSAQAGDADWLRCAELRESAPRLACYDAQAARLRQAPAGVGQVSPAAAGAQAAQPAAAAAERVAAFGAPQRVPAQEIDAVESRILGRRRLGTRSGVRARERPALVRIADGSSAVMALQQPQGDGAARRAGHLPHRVRGQQPDRARQAHAVRVGRRRRAGLRCVKSCG
jgi:hypothetical protein